MNYLGLLGTKGGPAIRSSFTIPTKHLLLLEGRPIVKDCGLGLARGLIDQGIALKDIHHIFIPHLHSDHYLESATLLRMAWPASLSKNVQIYGPAGLYANWAGFLA